MDRLAQNEPSRFRNRLRLVAICLGVVALLAGISVYAVSSLTAFLPLRQALAEEVLTSILNRPVEVRGPVDLTIGRRMSVRIEDAFVRRSDDTSEEQARAFEHVSFDAGYALLAGDISVIRNYRMRGAEIVYGDRQPRADRSEPTLFRLPSQITNSPVLRNLELSDVVLRYQDASDGWNETLRIHTFELTTPEASGETDIVFEATLNGTPLSVTGKVQREEIAGNGYRARYELVLDFPGLSSRTSGTIDTSSRIARVEGKTASVSESLQELSSSFGIVSQLDGHATLDYAYKGPLDQLVIDGLQALVAVSNGDQIDVSGGIKNSTGNPVVDLDFKAELADLDPDRDNLFAVQVTELSGNVSGSLNELSIDRAQIRTTAAVLNFDDIGPISVGRIVRHPDDRVGLENITIQAGPEDDPHVLLNGQMEDALGLKGISLDGIYRFPLDQVLGFDAGAKPELGVLEGEVSMNEAAGRLGIADLSGEIVETTLLDLGYDLSVPELRTVNELSFTTTLGIPEPALLLNALDVATDRAFPAIGFDGASTLSPKGVGLTGKLTSGETDLEADIRLHQGDEKGSRFLGGAVTSDRMDFADLASLIDFAQLGFDDDAGDFELSEDFKKTLAAQIDLDVKEIVTGAKKAGNLSATAQYADHLLQLSKLSVNYIGGTIRGDFALNMTSEPGTASANGRMEKFPLKRLMTELGLSSPISSTVYSSFKVQGSAASGQAFLKSLSGSVTTSLWGGVLPGRLLELSGMSAFTWMVTGNDDNTTKLVCAVLPLKFKNGTATTSSMIVETANVQIVGAGSLSFRTGALNLSFLPRAKRKQLVAIVSPFELHGTIKSPELEVKEGGAGRAIGEVASLPLNLIGHIFRGSGPVDEKAKPCVLPKNSTPK